MAITVAMARATRAHDRGDNTSKIAVKKRIYFILFFLFFPKGVFLKQ